MNKKLIKSQSFLCSFQNLSMNFLTQLELLADLGDVRLLGLLSLERSQLLPSRPTFKASGSKFLGAEFRVIS